MTIAGRDVATSALTYLRRHPMQVAAAAGSLFLADLLNLAIAIDKLDPVVRLVSAISKPAERLLTWLRRLVMTQRAKSLAGIAVRAGAPIR